MSLSFGNMWKGGTIKQIKPTNKKKSPVQKFVTRSAVVGTKPYWGQATWFLFHTIACRIDSEYYVKNYVKVWSFIHGCLSNLPCPYCRMHALSYIKNKKAEDVNTREKLEDFFFAFHNHVNKNTHKKQYLKKDLKKYKRAKIDNIFKNFEMRFFKTYFGSREFSGWIRNSFKNQYNKFFKEVRPYCN